MLHPCQLFVGDAVLENSADTRDTRRRRGRGGGVVDEITGSSGVMGGQAEKQQKEKEAGMEGDVGCRRALVYWHEMR